MADTSQEKQNNHKKHICIGILAHVDAGKTTLSESMLYTSGSIRKLGRVDHQDAFLDTFDLERARGITIFSKQAVFSWKDMDITLLDTPGHVDFSAEMERTLQVLDYAILVISGADGVQGHTATLWRLLKQYQIPTFLFINKMDQEGTDRKAIIKELKKQLSDGCVDFEQASSLECAEDEWLENLAVCDEEMLEEYLENGTVEPESVIRAISGRKIFPCYFGSALRLDGVQEFMEGLRQYTVSRKYPDEFGAKVYKIARDDQGNRLTYLKVTGGCLHVKDMLPGMEEKVNQIRIYSGSRFEMVQEVNAGGVCAVTGLSTTYPGQGIGAEKATDMFVLEPVLTYQIQLPPGCDVHNMLQNLRQLEEEEPQLHIVWEEQLGEIHAQLMGEVQIEILKNIIFQRFGVAVEFGAGNIVYKETIEEPVEGVGHFEPLRHYAEVHLLLEPGERETGLQFFTDCSEDVLDRNWQRLIMTHLEEKEHKGVLTGSAITDMKITLTAGKSHLKHTEGGDFRQATYRAVRQGLKKAKSILLEPWYEFRMEMPSVNIGRAMADIQKMHGQFEHPETDGEMSVLKGSAPVSEMRGYQSEFLSYTGGHGRMFCSLKGYEPCHNQEEIIESVGYDSEKDLENPTGSVFCAHGAGFVVKWNQVEEYMHVESTWKSGEVQSEEDYIPPRNESSSRIELTEKELDAIYRKTPDPVRRKISAAPITVHAKEKGTPDPKWTERQNEKTRQEEYLLVDGYNIIFAWEELKELAEIHIESARDKLMDILCNYQGYKKCTVILVFDAYKVEGNPGEVLKYHNIYVVYTKEAETADQYIEKTVRQMGRKYQVTVATSDALEQVIILGQGAQRLSAAGLKEEVELMLKEIRSEFLGKIPEDRNYLFDYLSHDLAKEMEHVRLGGRVKK
ncbi:MAG: TetM/TetW/TetO/TetS family tetracycline resistance ribosomal protection protein [Faecalicatena sp.]|uniref:translation factor GTPase family protein n=1 Tax=Faecalicatena sp. TaxID=2005360 RepID=UPI002584BD1F|nr:TetM/TetW/TetO/TetS family tetracycline resistance ribosomal protection protein [Faecalicatena sp.]MCI6466677.1 TetM/TetW/TetO/TetS family tetracycline resistance ribosomal protection protein [Faecalicatena sp.]MDY5620651.1 translation factor GTPase family protein [Lachnospiraceae bacterium]